VISVPKFAFGRILSLAAYGAFLRGWWIPIGAAGDGLANSAVLITAYMLNQEKRAGATDAIILAACLGRLPR
jgi:CHASE2 domain-containing sensor protein